MLTSLFGSKTRVKILKLFLLHPNSKYYIREISRKIDVQVNSARRELNNLEKFGLLMSGTKEQNKTSEKKDENIKKSKKRSNKEKYYRVNKNFSLFNEIRTLIVNAQVLYKEDFIENIKKIGEPQLVVLTGLFVGIDDSIVDVFIVGDIKRSDLLKIITDLENKLGREVNFSLMDMEEFQYRQQITDIFIYNTLESKKLIPVNKIGIH